MILGLALAGLLTVAIVALGVAFSAADKMTRSKRHRVQGTPADHGLRYEEVQFLTSDRVTLRGWYLDSPGARATIVIVHHLEATRADPDRGLLRLQRDYVRRGFSVFAFDLRGHGESAGRRDSMGSKERLDVHAAVAYVRRRVGSAPVLLHGFGFGAALALDAAAKGAEVTAVIADSPFTSMRAWVRLRFAHLPRPILALATRLARWCFRADVEALAPIRIVDRIGVPVLFIHNEGDDDVPATHTVNLGAASLDPRDRVWIVPDRWGHADANREVPDQYLHRCLQFVDEVVPARTLLTAQAV
jgi:alpha/beta superfamily hydrolase